MATSRVAAVVLLCASFVTVRASFSVLPDMPTGRYDLGLGVVDSKLYVAGGRTYSPTTYFDTMEVYSLSTSVWTTGVPMPVATWNADYFTANSKLYMMGGYTPAESPSTSTQVVAYDAPSSTWETLAALPSTWAGMRDSGVCTFESDSDTVYFVGGQSDAPSLYTTRTFTVSTSTWETLHTSNPSTFYNGMAACMGSKIYITGGPSKYQTYVYTLATSTWASGTGLAPSPYPTLSPIGSYGRAFGGAASHGSSMYVFGGLTSTNSGLSTSQELSPNSPVGTSYWQTGAYLYHPTGPVQNFGTTTYQPTSKPTPTVVVVGGQGSSPTSQEKPMMMTWTLPDTEDLPYISGSNKKQYGSAFIGSVLYITGGNPSTTAVNKYTVSTSAWTTGTSMPSAAGQFDHYVASVNSKLYLTGGYPDNSNHYVMDPATNSWASAPAMPSSMYNGGATGTDGKFFVIGGQPSTYDKHMYAYTVATSTWGRLPDMPRGRYSFNAASSSSKIYAVGGYDPSFGITSDVDVYEIPTSTWSGLPALPIPMYRNQAGVIGSVLWATGDANGRGGNLYSYTPGSWEWVAAPPLRHPTYDGDGGVYGSTIYMLAGYSPVSHPSYTTFESYTPPLTTTTPTTAPTASPAPTSQQEGTAEISWDGDVFQITGPLNATRYVTHQPIAFSATKSSQQDNIGTGTIVRFDTIITNLGNALSPGTSRFTAPVHGLYQFSAKCHAVSSNGVGIALYKNAQFTGLGSISSTTIRAIAQVEGMLELQIGDEVAVTGYMNAAGDCEGGSTASFTGNLISQM